MALCLADSLLACGGLDQRDLMERFLRWWRHGENSCTGGCFDIGNTVSAALRRFEESGEPIVGSTDPRSAGNGSLMRLSPAAIRWHGEPEGAEAAARTQSVTTHGAPAAVEACAYFVRLLVEAINGRPREKILAPRCWPAELEVDAIAQGSWIEKPRSAIRASGFVIHTLEAALWSVGQTHNFRDAVLLAANLGEDADTVAAVTGQLAGALWSVTSIPVDWQHKLAWSDKIVQRAEALYTAGAPS